MFASRQSLIIASRSTLVSGSPPIPRLVSTSLVNLTSRPTVSRPLSSSSSTPSPSPSPYRTMTMTVDGYRPFLLSPVPGAEVDEDGPIVEPDWTAELELDTVKAISKATDEPLKVLVLYGSLRDRSYSKLMAFEAARILHHLGCDVRIYDPRDLPIKDESSVDHPKVQELRGLSEWSDSHFWCSPEQHGNLTAVFKNQIDWIPLSVGSVRPTQGRTVAISQVNGGSQSFNAVNSLRILGRWMRMFVIPNQSSLPMAWKAFTPAGRLRPSSNRDRLVDVCEELVKVSIILRPHFGVLGDRYSERVERREKGRLRTQAEVEAEKEKEKEKDRGKAV